MLVFQNIKNIEVERFVYDGCLPKNSLSDLLESAVNRECLICTNLCPGHSTSNLEEGREMNSV